jgi:hypothetical protein
MRYLLTAFFAIFCAFFFTHCTSNNSPSDSHNSKIVFRVKNMKTSAIYMYSCMGTRQMLIDSLPVQQDSASVAIPAGTPPGMYRFMANEAIVDLIISDEDIEVHIDGANEERSIHIERSSENQWLYKFLYAYNDEAASDSFNCDVIHSLQQTYISEKAPVLARQYIELFLHGSNCDNQAICINSLLLKSAYTDGLIKSILTEQSNNGDVKTLFDNMIACSDTAQQVQHELYTACWDAGIEANKNDMLNAVLQEPDADFKSKFIQLSSGNSLQTIVAGTPFPSKRIISDFIPNSMSLYYVIIHEGAAATTIPEISNVKNYLDRTRDRYFMVSGNELSDEVKREIGYISGSMIFMVGKNDILADKWIGKRDIQNLR